MDLILLILAASPIPLRASKLAELCARDVKAVRVTLLRLQSEGLAARHQVATGGPQGTFEWKATPAGSKAAREVLAFVRAKPTQSAREAMSAAIDVTLRESARGAP